MSGYMAVTVANDGGVSVHPVGCEKRPTADARQDAVRDRIGDAHSSFSSFILRCASRTSATGKAPKAKRNSEASGGISSEPSLASSAHVPQHRMQRTEYQNHFVRSGLRVSQL
jgi:hypothetical protein